MTKSALATVTGSPGTLDDHLYRTIAEGIAGRPVSLRFDEGIYHVGEARSPGRPRLLPWILAGALALGHGLSSQAADPSTEEPAAETPISGELAEEPDEKEAALSFKLESHPSPSSFSRNLLNNWEQRLSLQYRGFQAIVSQSDLMDTGQERLLLSQRLELGGHAITPGIIFHENLDEERRAPWESESFVEPYLVTSHPLGAGRLGTLSAWSESQALFRTRYDTSSFNAALTFRWRDEFDDRLRMDAYVGGSLGPQTDGWLTYTYRDEPGFVFRHGTEELGIHAFGRHGPGERNDYLLIHASWGVDDLASSNYTREFALDGTQINAGHRPNPLKGQMPSNLAQGRINLGGMLFANDQVRMGNLIVGAPIWRPAGTVLAIGAGPRYEAEKDPWTQEWEGHWEPAIEAVYEVPAGRMPGSLGNCSAYVLGRLDGGQLSPAAGLKCKR